MRIRALMMAGLLAGTAQAAERHDWVGIISNESDTAMTFIDLPTLSRGSDDIYTMRQSIVLTDTSSETAALTATLRVDCAKTSWRRIDLQAWRVDGSMIRGGPADSGWKFAEEGTVARGVVNFVCKMPDLSDGERYPRTSDALPTATARRILSRSAT